VSDELHLPGDLHVCLLLLQIQDPGDESPEEAESEAQQTAEADCVTDDSDDFLFMFLSLPCTAIAGLTTVYT